MTTVLGIDVGASLTKTGTIFDDWTESFKDYSNKIWAHDGEKKTEDYDLDEKAPENTLDLSFEFGEKKVENFSKEVGILIQNIQTQRWIIGNLAEDMSSDHQSIASDALKVKQEEFYLNILGVAFSSVVEHGLDPDDLVLGVLVPPRDYFNDLKEVLFSVLGREITITNNTTGKKVTLNLTEDKIQVKPESIVSFVASFVSDDNEMTEAGEKYGELLNVSIDMGYSTTDVAIMDNFKPKKNSFETFDFANAQLQKSLSDAIQREKGGYIPSSRELITATHTGKITMGARKEWIGEELKEANEKFARQLYDSIFAYLRSHDIALQQVASFMFSGGGSVEVTNVKSIRQYFMDKVNDVSEYTESFTPAEYLSVENHVDYETEDLTPQRYSNILGFVRGLRQVKSGIDGK